MVVVVVWGVGGGWCTVYEMMYMWHTFVYSIFPVISSMYECIPFPLQDRLDTDEEQDDTHPPTEKPEPSPTNPLDDVNTMLTHIATADRATLVHYAQTMANLPQEAAERGMQGYVQAPEQPPLELHECCSMFHMACLTMGDVLTVMGGGETVLGDMPGDVAAALYRYDDRGGGGMCDGGVCGCL